jgi:signal transduction histidine kinase
MRERAEALGADLEIESRPGRGTRVEVYWEIENVRLEGEKTHV